MNETASVLFKISLKFLTGVQINNIPALAHIMAWRRLGDKPLSEPMMVRLLAHTCVTRLQCVKAENREPPRTTQTIFPPYRAGLPIVTTNSASWSYRETPDAIEKYNPMDKIDLTINVTETHGIIKFICQAVVYVALLIEWGRW